MQHILNVTPEILQSVMEHAVSRFLVLAENGRKPTEDVLHQSRDF